MFKIDAGSPRTIWAPVSRVSSAITLYVGQLVQWPVGQDGVYPLAVASGAGDTSNKQVIYGVVVGTGDLSPLYNATYGQYIASVQSQADLNARSQLGLEGMYVKGDKQAMVQIALIDANTVLKGDIRNAAIGTGPSLLTVTTGSTTGAGFTSNACDFTPVAYAATTYCRTGANAGQYRISSDTSTTVETNNIYWSNDIAVGDTFVRVPLKQGIAYGQINSTSGALGLWLEASASPATNYFILDVLELNLKEANREYALFRFAPCHFDLVRT